MMRLCLCVLTAILLTACVGVTPTPVVEVPTLAQLPTLTATFTPSDTPTLTETPSAEPTLTETPTPSPTLSVTPSITITDTYTPTPTSTATETPEPQALSLLVQLAMEATVLPPTYTINLPPPAVSIPTVVTLPPANVTCAYPPPGGFSAIYTSDAALSGQLGCPLGAPPAALSIISASQLFERGAMFYLAESPAHIYVLFGDGRYRRYDDTFVAGVDLERGGESPPANLIEPIRGFGKIWRANQDVRASIGWAITAEAGNEARVQDFDRGRMVYLPQRNETIVLVADPDGLGGAWRAFTGGA